MNSTALVSSDSPPSVFSHMDRQFVKKWALIAIATIFALGMIFSYVLAAPWLVTVGFFAMTLIPLYPVSNVAVPPRQNIE